MAGFLRAGSGLPGPRANLELAQAAADVFDLATYRCWCGSDDEYLAVCGAIGLGRLAAAGDRSLLADLRRLAGDSRWRVREGVVMGLQRMGEADMPDLIDVMERWSGGTPLEQRAAIAALCEPRLLRRPEEVRRVLALLDRVTAALAAMSKRQSDAFRVLRLGLGYCWSVAAAADPEGGRPLLEKWLKVADPDVRWVMKHNLGKHRIERLGPDWLARWRAGSS